MLNHVLSPDTQAILLLCSNFGQNRKIEPQPLTLSEYNSLTNWLRNNQMRPADLLEPIAGKQLQKIGETKLDLTRISALLERGAMLSLAVEKWTNQGLWILGRGDTNYPKCLKQTLKHSAPAVLYGVGNIKLLSMGGLAIVGSRDVDEEKLEYTKKIAQQSAVEGIQVISGGARGVDKAAMLGVLQAGGTSVGVLANSLTKASVDAEYRSSIKEGRLALISSYDPDAGFNVGNAMGRNKYIYALADYAVVVDATAGKGGTWAGAVEAISKLHLAVFVKMHPTISEGNQQLHDKGAKVFPPEPWNDLKQLLKSTASLIEPSAETKEISSTSKEIYEAVLPLILDRLQQPLDAKTLAETLNVRLSQMQDWLNEAVEEGKIKKTQKPVTYVINQSATQLSMFSN
ncbi:DNA-processing protein DprA [Rivularia sp. UHCC 0363]|uniref:DNA-processing protein DprA n=1 Tax=Rivularia sp. UHCC 0363 TaxID=3110244 RepID=UPI002B20DAEA|nr:DNA-processing protein DprA [Rivularia sp. UHCC 0363]MEA5593733.1 DNA-processing protein DprA [Rivularia sp. UHCC 0363]